MQDEQYPPDSAMTTSLFSTMEIDPTVVAVIVGTDFRLSNNKMSLASHYINSNDADLIGTNIDRNDGKFRLRPSGGSLTKLI